MFFILSCTNNSIKNENIRVEKTEHSSYSIESVKLPLSTDSANSILLETREIAKQKTFREAIPILENRLNANSFDANDKLVLELQLSEYYLLFYLIENKNEYFDKADSLLENILAQDSSSTIISSYFDVDTETLKEFKSKWNSTSNKKTREELLIKALIEKFKTTNPK
jgi:hypothetical protein